MLGLLWALPGLLRAQLPPGFVQVQLADGLDPTAMSVAPDGRVFISEKSGRIRIWRDGRILPEPFLSIKVDNYNERGLGGMVLDPDFERNNFVYLFFTVPGQNFNRVSRFVANGDYVLPESERVLLDMDRLAGTIHNGGAMAFGADGKLYIATGDGSNASNSQNLNNLLGKILRINPDGSIPTDNPFYQQTTGRNRAIWALGLRNPFTFDLHWPTGRIFANEVGSEYWEEVNEIVKGGNYGWPGIEGKRVGENAPTNYRDPVHAYSHREGCAVIGSAFYEPPVPGFPEKYRGKYFFADYCLGYIKVLNPANGQIEETFLRGADRPVSIRTGPDGHLYYLARGGLGGGSEQDNTSSTDGSLWRIEYRGDGAPVVAIQPKNLVLPVGDDALFSVQASGAATLQYQWFKNNQAIMGATEPRYVFPNVQLGDDGATFFCTINNKEGQVRSNAVTLRVTPNTRPSVQLLRPDPNWRYRAGDTLFFAAQATDLEDGNLQPTALSWRIDFHHDEHYHPALDEISGIANGYFVIPRLGETDDNVFYRLTCTAHDRAGLARTVTRDVQPRKTTFIVKSEPPGITVIVDGQRLATPATITSVEGIRRTIIAPNGLVQGNNLLGFDQWNNRNTSPIFSFLAGEVTEMTANYRSQQLSLGEGRGLKGRYYQTDNRNSLLQGDVFNLPPVLSRVDTSIRFAWGLGTPEAQVVEVDYFAVRWSGEILAPFTDEFTFFVAADDGVRLWVDGQLIINQWVPQPVTEVIGRIKLTGGKRYAIVLEYFEDRFDATVTLSWASPLLNKEIIPRRQLYPDITPDDLANSNNFAIRAFPSPFRENFNLFVRSKWPEQVTLKIADAGGRKVYEQPLQVNAGLNQFNFPLNSLPSGVYFLHFAGGVNPYGVLRVVKR